MAYNRFYWNIFLRLVFLSLTNLGFFYFLVSGERFFTTLFLGILIIIQVVWLFYYINIINLNLSRFLLMLGEEETVITPLKSKVEKTFGGLQSTFKRLNIEMAKARLENEFGTVLLQNVVDHAGAGILAWDQDGKIEFINVSAKKILEIPDLEFIQDIDKLYPRMYAWLLKLRKKEKGTWGMERNGSHIPLAFRATGFNLGDKMISLVSFQSIRAELEQTEMESWEKLIRVLTHEVSNSVTPITTLGSNIRKRMDSVKKEKSGDIILSEEIALDLQRSAELIEQRGIGLIDFIGQYKTFMRLPDPDLRQLSLSDLIDDSCQLGENLDSASPFQIISSVETPGAHCLADKKMIEQVLINLIRNSIEAFSSDGEGLIEITGGQTMEGAVSIQVKDNGTGIPEAVRDQVFIPFFTTKEKGSGIGLSFCRRIILMNGGSIQIASTGNSGTTIRLTLPAV